MEECSVVFEELQEAHTQYAVDGYLNRFSKLYESHFEALCNALDEDVLVPFLNIRANPQQLNTQPSDTAEIDEEVANISAATTLIHLTQAIYFQPNPSAIMAEDLMHWVNRLESRPDPLEGEDIMRRHPACHHPSYWSFIHKYLQLIRLQLTYCIGLRRAPSLKLQ
jgi:Nup85 Nucleoporin